MDGEGRLAGGDGGLRRGRTRHRHAGSVGALAFQRYAGEVYRHAQDRAGWRGAGAGLAGGGGAPTESGSEPPGNPRDRGPTRSRSLLRRPEGRGAGRLSSHGAEAHPSIARERQRRRCADPARDADSVRAGDLHRPALREQGCGRRGRGLRARRRDSRSVRTARAGAKRRASACATLPSPISSDENRTHGPR